MPLAPTTPPTHEATPTVAAVPESDAEAPADAPAEAVIQIDGVSKRFGGRPAVIDLTLSVPRGSVFGLLGHNGAGKSTTLGMVLGQVFPDTGRVRIGGHDVFRHRRLALGRVGAIFEAPAFYDYLSAWRNLCIFCDLTARAPRAKLEEVVHLVGLSDRIGHKVSTYSHGMRQRLALAQALVPDPELLILDEPADGLDPEGIREMRALMHRLSRDMGLTLLFSSHLLAEVEAVCDEVAVMHRGRLIYRGNVNNALFGGERLLELDCDRRDDALTALNEARLIDGETPGGKLRLRDDIQAAAVNRFLVERGFDVTAIGPSRLTLEEFYLRTVGEMERS